MRLFFYGVLLEGLGDWPFLKGIGPSRHATARGKLFGIRGEGGWFPALLPGDGLVHGAVHDAGSADIGAMDAFEGEEYSRNPIVVETIKGPIEAHAYVWTGALPQGSEPIEQGDFARWLDETGRQPIDNR